MKIGMTPRASGPKYAWSQLHQFPSTRLPITHPNPTKFTQSDNWTVSNA